jgi:hypothetical protein
MTAMQKSRRCEGRGRLARAARAGLLICVALVCNSCSTGHPPPLGAGTLAEAQTFPYFRVYWAGSRFLGQPLSSVDGQKGYISSVGDSVYYGDCVRGKGIFGGGSCLLPLQVTTVIYRLHSNATLGPQRNALLRGVPATIYDEGRSIELYSGRVAIDVFSDTPEHALAAAQLLQPINAPGSAGRPLPPPVYCPGLYGAQSTALQLAMSHLPRHVCQRASAVAALAARA